MRSRSVAVFKRRSVAAGNNQATHWYQTVSHCRFLNMCFVQLICERSPVSRKSILWLLSNTQCADTVPTWGRHVWSQLTPQSRGAPRDISWGFRCFPVFFYAYQDLLRLLPLSRARVYNFYLFFNLFWHVFSTPFLHSWSRDTICNVCGFLKTPLNLENVAIFARIQKVDNLMNQNQYCHADRHGTKY